MSLSRRDLLRAGAAAALTAACAPASSTRAKSPGTTTPSTGASGAAGSSVPPTKPTTPATAVPRRPATEVGSGNRSTSTVALTFHGNGDPALADRLLSLLEAHRVKGSVLAVGAWLAAHPEMAGRVTSAGHDLGNHTQHHLPMRGLGAAQAFAEIQGCAHALTASTGTIGRWFRASGTQHTTPTIRAAAGRVGYASCVSYDVDGLDWRDPPRNTVVTAVLSGARRGSIVSLHLGHSVTIEALPAVLDGLHSRGLRPVTLTELLA